MFKPLYLLTSIWSTAKTALAWHLKQKKFIYAEYIITQTRAFTQVEIAYTYERPI